MELLVGTYTQPTGGGNAPGRGIHAVSFDPDTANFSEPELLAECTNPSAIAFDPSSRTLFAVREVFRDDTPELISFRIRGTQAEALSHLPLNGELPCHLAFDGHTGRIASAQYWTGDVVVSAVKDGKFSGTATVFEHAGKGPDEKRQQGPHAHCAVFTDGGQVLHSVDLGADAILSRRLDAFGAAEETSVLQVTPGCGPRHMVTDRDETRAYVICELSETLLGLKRSGLGWEVDDSAPAFASPEGGNGACAAIRLSEDGRHVYVSGRRQSRIAQFDVTSGIRKVAEYETGGEWPRDITLSRCGAWMFCGNQNSGTVTALRRDLDTGRLSGVAATCNVGSPVAILELPE